MFTLMFRPLRHFADFKGRSTRGEYWLFYLFSVVLGVVLAILTKFDFSVYYNPELAIPSDIGLLMHPIFIASYVIFFPSLAVAVRRLHDTNRSGWWVLILFLPFVGPIWYLVLMLLRGTRGVNHYGPDLIKYD